MGERRAVLERLRHVDDRVERLPVDLDELGRVTCLRAGLGDNDGDPVALVASHVGQRVVRRVPHVLGDRPSARHRSLPVVLEVGRREHGDHTVCFPGRLEVDSLDTRVRVRAANDDHECRSGRRHIVDERAAAC